MKIYIFKTVYIQIYCFETYYTLNGLNYYIWVSGKWYKGIGYNMLFLMPFCIHKMRKLSPFAV